MSAATRPKTVGLCVCCQQPVRAGEERRETIDRATGAVPDLLLHQRMCKKVITERRWLP